MQKKFFFITVCIKYERKPAGICRRVFLCKDMKMLSFTMLMAFFSHVTFTVNLSAIRAEKKKT